ncbi:hypothetical protein G5I_12938 [Acromyrmex echinatior]|uniref:Uncharacterized protein n=1 Tax=Acromyrmex echinatior TaxID=103372 RepID=F4X3N0_ACREC|nr:hypothetical protein G5I_12938 [Acromyrmex echinatior]
MKLKFYIGRSSLELLTEAAASNLEGGNRPDGSGTVRPSDPLATAVRQRRRKREARIAAAAGGLRESISRLGGGGEGGGEGGGGGEKKEKSD